MAEAAKSGCVVKVAIEAVLDIVGKTIQNMKTTCTSLLVGILFTFSAHSADFSVSLTDVHLCCDSCVKGAEKAIAKVKQVAEVVNKDDETIKLTGPDKATVQKAVDSLVAAGFFGKSSDASIKVDAITGAKGQKVQAIKISEVHLCCPKCVKSVNSALESVPGVKANTATKGAKVFEVTGDFNDKDVFDALQKAGLTGKEE